MIETSSLKIALLGMASCGGAPTTDDKIMECTAFARFSPVFVMAMFITWGEGGMGKDWDSAEKVSVPRGIACHGAEVVEAGVKIPHYKVAK